MGQFDDEARSSVRGVDRTIWLADDAIWITLLEPVTGTLKREAREGNGESEPDLEPRQGVHSSYPSMVPTRSRAWSPVERLDTTISYFIGNDPQQWHPAVPVWGGVRYHELYPGVDLELLGDNQQLRPNW